MTIKRFNILIFGEVLADVFPEQTIIGGAPYNVARHLQSFGLAPVLLTKIGVDTYGDLILQEMRAHGLACGGVQRDALYPTGQVKVTFTETGHQFEILPNQAYDAMDADAMQNILNSVQPAMVYIGTLALRNARTRAVAQILLARVACPIFCDINLRMPWYTPETIRFVLNHANIVKINHEELAEIAAMLGIQGEAEKQARALQAQYALDHVFITCGEQGSWWLNNKQVIKCAKKGVLMSSFIDSVGAGDAYSAVIILGLLQAWDEDLILQRASDFAAEICGVRGAVPATKDVYDAALRTWVNAS